MATLVRDVTWRPSGTIRQGITIGGIDVVIVAMSVPDIDYCRQITEAAVTQYGLQLLTRGAHPPIRGDQPLTAPIADELGRLIGYVELAP